MLATTGSKMSHTLQHMHQKKENVGCAWTIAPMACAIIQRISAASIDHLVIIAHELFQLNPEFRFKKHATDVIIDTKDGKSY